MQEATLPSPNIGATGFHLRRVAVKAISQLEMIAPSYPGGKHPDAATLAAFFTSCATYAMAIGGGDMQLMVPSGYAQDFDTYGIKLYMRPDGSTYTTYDDSKIVPASVAAGPTFYVVKGRPNNGAGTSEATAFGHIGAAINALNATSGGATIMIKGDGALFTVAEGMADPLNQLGTGAIRPTKPFVIKGYGATPPILSTVREGLTWAAQADGTYTTSRSLTGRILDKTSNDANGDWKDIPLLADDAAVSAAGSSGGWYLELPLLANGSANPNAGRVRVKRPDGQPVTDANTALLMHAENVVWGAANIAGLIDNIVLHGGSVGVNGRGGGQKIILHRRMKSLYAGSPVKAAATGGTSLGGNAFVYAGLTAGSFIAHDQCEAARSAQDGISHTGSHPWFTSKCIGRDNGMAGQVSCNGLTQHENCYGTDEGGNYPRNAGGNVRHVGATKFWGVGTKASSDRGDQIFGGATVPSDFHFADTVEAWLDTVTASGSTNSLVVGSQSKVHTRNATFNGTVIKNGQLDTYA